MMVMSGKALCHYFVRIASFLLLVVAPTTAAAQELWRGIHHGMTLEQAHLAIPSAKQPDEEVAWPDGSRMLLVFPDELGGVEGEGRLIFRDGAVVRVTIRWPANESGAKETSAKLEAAAVERFGTPTLDTLKDRGRDLGWRPDRLAIDYSAPTEFWGPELTLRRQDAIIILPTAFVEAIPPADRASLAEWDAMPPERQSASLQDITLALYEYYADPTVAPAAANCLAGLVKEETPDGPRLLRMLLGALQEGRAEGLLHQPIAQQIYAALEYECNPSETERQLRQMREAATQALEDSKRQENAQRARLEELDSNAWELPDGTKVYAGDRSGVWHYSDGSDVPEEFARLVRPPGHEMAPTPAPEAAVSIAGTYSVSGVNPDGSRYSGTLRIDGGDDSVYSFRWRIGSQTFRGSGRFDGDQIAVDFGDPFPVIYRRYPDGTLSGTWANGQATESLTPR